MTEDYLTCGQCLKEFPLQCIAQFIQHKKLDCDDDTDEVVPDPELRCNNCPQGFMTAWSLLVHAQLTHNLKIFLENATKTVLKRSGLTPKDSRAVFPAVQTIRNVEASEISSSEHREMITVAQKPSFLSDTGITRNAHSGESVTKERDKNMDVPLQDSCPLTSPQYSPKLVSNLTVTKNTTKIVEREPNQTYSHEENIDKKNSPKKINSPKKKEPIKTTVTTNISQPLNIYQMIPSTSALDQTSVGTATPLRKDQLINANFKVLPAAMVNPTSKTAQSNPTDDVQGSIPMLQKQFPDRTSTESVNGTNISQSSAQSLMAKPFPGIDFQGEQPKLVIAEDDLTLKEIENTSNKNGKSEENGSSPKQCLDEISMDVSSQECCDSQDCGVKVIPVSHEHLKKCCNAVVPKKRKRHMELKHMPFVWSSSRYASRKLLYRSKASSSARSNSNQFLSKTSANTIYIDVEPDSVACADSKGKGNDETSLKVTQSSSALEISTNEASSKIPVSGTQNKQRSLILKPCSIFSIPLTYTIPASQTTSNVSKSNPKAANSLADLKLESASSTSSTSSLASLTSASRSEENQSTVALQRTNTKKSPIVRNDGKGSGRSRQPVSKPFKCDKCPSAFNQRIHLQKHMSKHTGIKPYKCGECNYATVERSHLKVHIRIHTGEKPFKCTYCEYATAQNSTLKIHLKRHHGGKMFQCGSCDKQFTQKEQLTIHEWEHGNKTVVSPELKTPEDVKILLPAEDFNQEAGICPPTNQMYDDNS